LLSGLERSLAGNLQEACGGNLEMVLNMHMENGEFYFFPLLSGLERSLAGNLLEACGGNLEMALSMHMVKESSISFLCCQVWNGVWLGICWRHAVESWRWRSACTW
jgi:hypothetical protein